MDQPDKIKVWELYYLDKTRIERIRWKVDWDNAVTPSWKTVKREIDNFLLLTPAQVRRLPDALQARWRELQPPPSGKGQEAPDEDLLSATKETFKDQLFTLAPEDILIDGLGSLGDHDARLRQNTLSVVLQSLGYTVGIEATVSTTTWGVPRPREAHIFWHVFPNLSAERYCPAERDPLFQDWLKSAPRLKQDIAEWNRLGGSYLADAISTRMKIRDAARQETRAWIGEILRVGPARAFAPQPLTANFGNLIYQLAIEYCRSEGARGLPDESSYDTMLANPPWVKLVLGQTRIPLGNLPPGLVETWIGIHRRMIVEWGESKNIGMLPYSFKRLNGIEEAIKQGLVTDYAAQQDSPPVV
ncbi:hypothetical protein ES703_30984 [subsurface metagenome]